MANDYTLKYEAEHTACYHCPAETDVEFDKFVSYLREAWKDLTVIQDDEVDTDKTDE